MWWRVVENERAFCFFGQRTGQLVRQFLIPLWNIIDFPKLNSSCLGIRKWSNISRTSRNLGLRQNSEFETAKHMDSLVASLWLDILSSRCLWFMPGAISSRRPNDLSRTSKFWTIFGDPGMPSARQDPHGRSADFTSRGKAILRRFVEFCWLEGTQWVHNLDPDAWVYQ